jgi:hypothetical protein
MTGSLAPPPPYGSEQGSILLEGGREGVREGMGAYIAAGFGHGRSSSQQIRLGRNQPTSPGPQRSPTDISLAQLSLVDSHEDDIGEGTSSAAAMAAAAAAEHHGLGFEHADAPPEYESPGSSPQQRQRSPGDEDIDWEDRAPLLDRHHGFEPPIPSYDAAVAEGPGPRERSDTQNSHGSRR